MVIFRFTPVYWVSGTYLRASGVHCWLCGLRNPSIRCTTAPSDRSGPKVVQAEFEEQCRAPHEHLSDISDMLNIGTVSWTALGTKLHPSMGSFGESAVVFGVAYQSVQIYVHELFSCFAIRRQPSFFKHRIKLTFLTKFIAWFVAKEKK